MEKLILLYFGTIFLAYLSQKYYPVQKNSLDYSKHFFRKRSDIYDCVIIAWLTLFSGLKTTYNDTWNYRYYYSQSPVTLKEYFSEAGGFDFTGNPLYYILQVILKSFQDNYHVLFMLIAFCNAYALVKIFKYYSPALRFTYVIFHSVGTYILFLASIKQSMAIAILIFALPYLLKHKWVPYFSLVLIAMMFHTHAFLYLFLPFFLTKPWGKLTYICFGVTLFVMFTYDTTLGTFMRYAQSIGANVVESEVFDGHSLSPIRVVVYSIPVIISFIFKKRLYADSSEIENLFSNMSLLSFWILSVGLIEGGNLFGRMAAYFEWGTAISLPWMLNKLFEKKSCIFVTGTASVCYFIYFIYEFTISKNFGEDYGAISIIEFVKSLF